VGIEPVLRKAALEKFNRGWDSDQSTQGGQPSHHNLVNNLFYTLVL